MSVDEEVSVDHVVVVAAGNEDESDDDEVELKLLTWCCCLVLLTGVGCYFSYSIRLRRKGFFQEEFLSEHSVHQLLPAEDLR